MPFLALSRFNHPLNVALPQTQCSVAANPKERRHYDQKVKGLNEELAAKVKQYNMLLPHGQRLDRQHAAIEDLKQSRFIWCDEYAAGGVLWSQMHVPASRRQLAA